MDKEAGRKVYSVSQSKSMKPQYKKVLKSRTRIIAILLVIGTGLNLVYFLLIWLWFRRLARGFVIDMWILTINMGLIIYWTSILFAGNMTAAFDFIPPPFMNCKVLKNENCTSPALVSAYCSVNS